MALRTDVASLLASMISTVRQGRGCWEGYVQTPHLVSEFCRKQLDKFLVITPYFVNFSWVFN